MARTTDYQTTASYTAPITPGEALRMTSFGAAIADLLTLFVYAFGAQLLIVMVGAMGWYVFKHHGINGDALWRLLQLSLLPWILAAIKTLSSVWMSARAPQVPRTYQAGAVERVKDYHLIPVTQEATLDNVPIPHVIEFVEQLHVRGHTMRQWVNKYRFDDGWLCDYDTWHNCCQILVKADILRGWGPRKKGRLRTTDADDILTKLRAMKLLG